MTMMWQPELASLSLMLGKGTIRSNGYRRENHTSSSHSHVEVFLFYILDLFVPYTTVASIPTTTFEARVPMCQ